MDTIDELREDRILYKYCVYLNKCVYIKNNAISYIKLWLKYHEYETFDGMMIAYRCNLPYPYELTDKIEDYIFSEKRISELYKVIAEHVGDTNSKMTLETIKKIFNFNKLTSYKGFYIENIEQGIKMLNERDDVAFDNLLSFFEIHQ